MDNEVQMEEPEEGQEFHASSSDKIDLSLDDIIKLNKKEQKANRAASRAKSKRFAQKNNVLKKLNQIPGQQRGRATQQDRGRARGLRRGSGRAMALRGASASNMTDVQFDQITFRSRGTFRGRGRGRGGVLSRAALSATGQRGRRSFTLDREFSPTKRAEKLQKYQRIRSQTTSSGSTLTVSLQNSTRAAFSVNRSFRGRQGGTVFRGRPFREPSSLSPKGIPLRFNYKATTNQTAVSLNDRFTGLKLRGNVRGKGRGRGVIGSRGRGRGATSHVEQGRERGDVYVTRGRGRRGLTRGLTRGRGLAGERILTRGRGGRGFSGGRGERGLTRGRGIGLTRGRGGRGLTRQGRGGSRGASRTVTLQ